MDFWRDPKEALSLAFTVLSVITALLVILGPFNGYADGWGKWVLVGVTAFLVAASSLVKKLPL